MITYATEFPIDSKHSVIEVLDLVNEWILGSPHTQITAANLATIKPEGETRIKLENEELIFGKAHLGSSSIGGVRYCKMDRNNEWVTSIICSSFEGKILVGIQVSCEAVNTATFMPSAKKPFFVRLALKRFSSGMDGEIPVVDKPFLLEEKEIEAAAKLINGEAKNRLPVIYVSATDSGSYLVDIKRLAHLVSGTAHIFVEPSRRFSIELKKRVNGRNPYGGSVAVFWPESSAKKSYFLNERKKEQNSIESDIAKDITIALSNRRPSSTCTWLHLKELISRAHYASLKAQGSTELEAYVKAFDEELDAKSNLLANAEKEIERLNSELRKNYTTATQISGGLINSGSEQSFYNNEIKSIVMDALTDSLSKFDPDSRPFHVLADIVKNNPVESDTTKNAARIKAAFIGYTNMTPKIRSELADLGFELTEEGKHFKAVYRGDGRYTFTISKSSSDHRAGKNLAGDINKILFKSVS